MCSQSVSCKLAYNFLKHYASLTMGWCDLRLLVVDLAGCEACKKAKNAVALPSLLCDQDQAYRKCLFDFSICDDYFKCLVAWRCDGCAAFAHVSALHGCAQLTTSHTLAASARRTRLIGAILARDLTAAKRRSTRLMRALAAVQSTLSSSQT